MVETSRVAIAGAAVHGPAVGILLAARVALMGACRTGRDYPEPASLRYAGVASPDTLTGRGATLRIVSFNIE